MRYVFPEVKGRSQPCVAQKLLVLSVNLLIQIKLLFLGVNPQIIIRTDCSEYIFLNIQCTLYQNFIELKIIFSYLIYFIMSNAEAEFPFQEFIAVMQGGTNLTKQLKFLLKAIAQHNIFWIYSSVSTIVEIVKGKEEEPRIKCRSLEAASIMLQSCEYPVVALFEIYLLPVLYEVAAFRGRKSEQSTSFYFQQSQGVQDSQGTRKLSKEYVQRSISFIFAASKIKKYRTVEAFEIKQQSAYVVTASQLKQKGIQQPKSSESSQLSDLRKKFLQKLSKFEQTSQAWAQFLLLNLIEEIIANKKQLLQLRQMLVYGQAYLTSALINLCQDELMELSDSFEVKRKYLSVLNELVRYGDMEAIIMIKNSQFLPLIVTHISKLQGHLGLGQGQNIYPQIKVSKQLKRQFYVDFLRYLENWAVSMPKEYDSDEFTLKGLYKLIKQDKKFQFPQNIHLNRYKKQLQENLIKNKERNDRLIEMLQNYEESKQVSKSPLSKVSNILQKTTLLPPAQLENRLQQAKKAMKELLVQSTSEKSFKILSSFKDNWITYLQSLDLEAADQEKLQNLILEGQKCVEQIHLIIPYYSAYSKKVLSYSEFKQKVREVLSLHNDRSMNRSQARSQQMSISKSITASKVARMGKSKIGGKQLHDKIKARSRLDSSQLDRSKIIDRSHLLDLSKCKLQNAKVEEKVEIQAITNERIEPANIRKEASVVEKDTSKILLMKEVVEQDEGNQYIVRIEDYEPTQKIQMPIRNRRESRQKGQRIILRRSKSKGSNIQKSSISQRSQERKSVKSNKKVKESSILSKTPRITAPTPNPKEGEQFFQDKLHINETIQVNGNKIKQGVPASKRAHKEQPQKQLNNFNEISSIHSNSVVKAFNNNSAQRILNLGSQLKSQSKIENPILKRKENVTVIKQVVQCKNQQKPLPVVGEYYQQPKMIIFQTTPKKTAHKINSQRKVDEQIHKNYFSQQGVETPKVRHQKELKHQKQVISIKHEEQRTGQPQRSYLYKAEKLSKIQKRMQIIQASELNKIRQSPPLGEEKDKQIATLHHKIRQLQKQTLLMKTRLAAKDNEIRSIRSNSKSGSERGYAQFTNLSQSHTDNSEKVSPRGSSVGRRKKTECSGFEKSVEWDYKQYLEKIKGSAFRKSLLKLKCLVHKTDQIEVGCMSQRNQKFLECTLFVTPHRYNLMDFSITVLHDNSLAAKILPNQIKLIPAKKQQKIHLVIELLKIPFSLPEIEINYKSDSEYSSNYNRLTLPICFYKFCQVRPLSAEQPPSKEIHYVKSDSFKLNSKIVKLQKIGESFPNFTVLPPSKQMPQVMITANCKYLDSYFNILINLQEKGSWIEGFLKRGEVNVMNFLICTFKQILDASKK